MAVSRDAFGYCDCPYLRVGPLGGAAVATRFMGRGDGAVCNTRRGDVDLFWLFGVFACGAGGGGVVHRADICVADFALCLWPPHRALADRGGCDWVYWRCAGAWPHGYGGGNFGGTIASSGWGFVCDGQRCHAGMVRPGKCRNIAYRVFCGAGFVWGDRFGGSGCAAGCCACGG